MTMILLQIPLAVIAFISCLGVLATDESKAIQGAMLTIFIACMFISMILSLVSSQIN